jgi:hypothetical protein
MAKDKETENVLSQEKSQNMKGKEVDHQKSTIKPDVVNNPSQEDLLKYTQEDFNRNYKKLKMNLVTIIMCVFENLKASS